MMQFLASGTAIVVCAGLGVGATTASALAPGYCYPAGFPYNTRRVSI